MVEWGLLPVTDNTNTCVHLVHWGGPLGKECLGAICIYGAAFDLKGSVWVCDIANNILKLSRCRPLQDIRQVGDGRFKFPCFMSVSSEGQIYTCDSGNDRVTVHDEEGKYQFTFGSKGSGPGCFDLPRDITFGSDGLAYVTDVGNKTIYVWLMKGTFKGDFKPKHAPRCIAATGDNHLLITSFFSHTVMVCTLDGQLVHEFGGSGSDPGKFNGPCGICVNNDGLVYVADRSNRHVQVF